MNRPCEQLAEEFPANSTAATAERIVFKTGKSRDLLRVHGAAALQEIFAERSADRDLLRSLAPTSFIAVPLWRRTAGSWARSSW